MTEPQLARQSPQAEPATDHSVAEAKLRSSLWRIRASHSRAMGILLVCLSGILIAAAFVSGYLVLEIASVASFLVGVSLLASEIEPWVKLFPSSESILGPLMTTHELLKRLRSSGSAVYQSVGEDVMMRITVRATSEITLAPVGQGLLDAYEREIGDLRDRGFEYVNQWLPRVMVDGLSLTSETKISTRGSEVETMMTKPFVRPLCVREFMTHNICNTIGCPLASSVGAAFAKATSKNVTHVRCVYDPKKQTATLVNQVSG